MTREFKNVAELSNFIGQEVGVSDWVTVDQAQINAFADATGDHQWIHIDPERAKAGPFGTTIAHGFLTLSLIPKLAANAMNVLDTKMGVNYGLNRVRFPAPVPAGSRLRARVKLVSVEPISQDGFQVVTEVAIEREGSPKPVCIAETVARRYH